MNNLYVIFIFCFLFTSVYSQVQKGFVREQNSGKKPIGGVQIIFNSAVPTTSDGTGQFRLTFRGKKAGDLIFYSEIRKSGYELVNEKELQVLKIGNTDRLAEDIILAKAGRIEAAKKEYYDISDKALKMGFDKENNALKEQLQQAKISQSQYLERLTTLQEQYNNQKQTIDVLADKFARVNFDDMEPLYNKALELFKAGKILETKKMLEEANLPERADQRIKERERISGAKKEIEQQEADNEKGIKQDIISIQLLVQTYLLGFEYDKAEILYDRLYLLDSTNLNILQETANFYRQYHLYDKALKKYLKIINHPSAEAWQKANVYDNLGDLYTTIGNLPDALQAFYKFNNIYAALSIKNPSNSYYKHHLAFSYFALGETYLFMGKVDTAMTFYKKGLQSTKEVYETNPQSVDFKDLLVLSYDRLGEIYTSLSKTDTNLTIRENFIRRLENYDTALIFYEKASQFAKELYETYPQNKHFKSSLANSYQRLGVTHARRGNLDTALTFYKKDLQLSKELYDAYQQNVDFKNGLGTSYERLGEIYTRLGNLDTALTFYEKESQLTKELYEAYPQNVDFKNGLACSYYKLAIFFRVTQNDQEIVRVYLQKAEQLWSELVKDSPGNTEYINNLKEARENLGE